MKHAEARLATTAPVVLAGDYNVIPTELDSISQNAGLMMRYFCPKCGTHSRASWRGLD